PQTVVSGRAVTGAPGLSLATPSLIGPENQLDFGRDSGDPFGSNTTAGGCGGPTDLAELVAVTNGVLAFAAGNCAHVEKSADGGISWDANGLPPGPTATPIICCDHDVIYDDSTRVVFHTSLYVSSDLSQSTVGIRRCGGPAGARTTSTPCSGRTGSITPPFGSSNGTTPPQERTTSRGRSRSLPPLPRGRTAPAGQTIPATSQPPTRRSSASTSSAPSPAISSTFTGRRGPRHSP